MVTPSDSPPDGGSGQDSGWRTAPPPSPFTPVRRWLLSTYGEIHTVRSGLVEEIHARAHLLPGRLLDDVAHTLSLVASELTTNAIRHGRPPAVVELLQNRARFLLTVADHDLTGEPRIAGDRPPGEGGFGLQIARGLSRDVGWYRAAPVKVVWAEVGP